MKQAAPGIWIVREQARPLADLLAAATGAEVATPRARAGTNRDLFRECYRTRPAWIFIGATGIATRYLDGLLADKKTDPCVVVVDEAARYAIALAGGHEGGANALAYRVADAVGAVPVITTASEALKTLVVGIGCRRGATAAAIGALVEQLLAQAGRDLSELREAASADLKRDEAGLLEWAAAARVPLRFFSRETLRDRPWVTRRSGWVMKNLGVAGVCEPCALMAAPRGRILVPKTAAGGVAGCLVDDAPEICGQ